MSTHSTLYIQGMHCRSCEVLIERNLKHIRGVTHVRAHYKTGRVAITYEEHVPAIETLSKAVEDAGYTLGDAPQTRPAFFSRNPKDYAELFIAAGSLFILFVLLRFSGFLDIAVNFGTAPSYLVVVLVGLVAGVSTCMALVGGLVLGVSARHAEKHPEATLLQNFRPHLFFNTGRVVGFAFLGGLLGTLGSFFTLSPLLLGFLVVFAGVFLVVLGLKLTEISPYFNSFSLTLPKKISEWTGVGRDDREYSHTGALFTGALTFFLPCGFTQAMQLYAVSTGSFFSGALIMGLFALGTAPGLLGVAGISSLWKGTAAKRFYKFAGVVVLVLAAINIRNGFSLAGLPVLASFELPSLVAQEDATDTADTFSSVRMDNGVQVVAMEQYGGGYRPNSFTLKKGVPVRWEITSTNPYTCASFLVVPSMGIRKALAAGQNIIEFTPTKTGPLRFTCSMGMYGGQFTVVD